MKKRDVWILLIISSFILLIDNANAQSGQEEDFICSGLVWENDGKYSPVEDSCLGYRCLVSNKISNSCYDEKQCEEACSTVCLSIPDQKKRCSELTGLLKGDFNGDGCVKFDDYLEFAEAFGQCNMIVPFALHEGETNTFFGKTMTFQELFNDSYALIINDKEFLIDGLLNGADKIEGLLISEVLVDGELLVTVKRDCEKYDLDKDDEIKIGDFLIFADNFNKCEEKDDIKFSNLREGQMLTNDRFDLNVRTGEESICGYKLFREVAVESADGLGDLFETPDGFVHSTTLKDLKDGNYNLIVKCDSKNIVREKSINFRVILEGINAEISVATEENYYYDDQQIILTDPPAKENNNFQSFALDIYEPPSTYDDLDSDVFIVEFYDDSLIRKRFRLEEERNIDDKKTEIIELERQGKNPILKKIALAFGQSQINSYLKDEKSKSEALHEKFKQDLFGSRLSKPSIFQSTKIIDEYSKILNGAAIETTPEIIEEIEKLDYVRKVEKEKIFEINLDASSQLIGANSVWETLDNDGLTVTGKGVRVAVIDTGVDYSHPDLGDCSTEEFLGERCEKVIGGYDFVNNDPDPMDDQGHGTHVAGIIAGTGIASNGKYKGIAPDAKIYAFKAGGPYGLPFSAILASWEAISDLDNDGIPFESREDRVDVASMSFGGGSGFSSSYDESSQIVDDLVRGGIVAVISAGNSGPGKNSIGSPGTSRLAITAGATTKVQNSMDSGGPDKISWFSSRGPTPEGFHKPDVVAPGGDVHLVKDEKNDISDYYGRYQHGIISTFSTEVKDSEDLCAILTRYGCIDDLNTVDEFYLRASGTSMSAPMISGAVALLLQKHPDWNPFEIKQALKNTAIDLGYDIDTQGYGRIDISKAVAVDEPPSLIREIKVDDNDLANVYGKINDEDVASYEIYIRSDNTAVWSLVLEAPIESYIRDREFLGSFDTSSLTESIYDIELRIKNDLGEVISTITAQLDLLLYKLTKIVSETGVDKNENGLIDLLKIDYEVWSRKDGPVLVIPLLITGSKNLFDAEFVSEAEIDKIVEIKKGSNILSSEFDGIKIKNNLNKHELSGDLSLSFVVFFDEGFPDTRKAIDLKNSYNSRIFEKAIDLVLSNIWGLSKFSKIFINEEIESEVDVYNEGTEPMQGTISLYEKTTDENRAEILNLISSQEIVDDGYNLKSFSFKYIPSNNGKKILKFIIENDNDIDLSNNAGEAEINVLLPGPDLWLLFDEENFLPQLISGKDNKILISLRNDGNVDAKNVKLSLFYNLDRGVDILIDEKIVDVNKRGIEKIEFSWNPYFTGNVFLSSMAVIENEVNPEDNVAYRRYTIIKESSDVFVRRTSLPDEVQFNKEVNFDIEVENSGVKEAKDVKGIVSFDFSSDLINIGSFVIPKIKSQDSGTETIGWIPDKMGVYSVIIELESEDDGDLNNNIYRKWITIRSEGPDVTGNYLWNVDKLVVGQTYDLEFNIRNDGLTEANDISILLFKEDELVDGRIIDRLGPRENNITTLRWAPKKEDIGWKNFKLVIGTEDDANPDNNEHEFSLRTLIDKVDIGVYIYSRKDFVIDKENEIIVPLVNNGGKDVSNMNLFLVSVDEITNEETLLDNTRIELLEFGAFVEIKFFYTPKETGIEIFKVAVEAGGDENLENNQRQTNVKIVPQSRLKNLGNDVLFGHLFMELQKQEGNEWKSHTVLIDDLRNDKARNVEKGDALALDKLFNEEYGELRIKDEGEFRIYVALLDESGNVIKTIEDKKLEASYQFRKRNPVQSEPVQPVPTPKNLKSDDL